MAYIFPIFQYEIRYNIVLDFSNHNRGLLAPYVKLAKRLGVDKQNNTGEEVLTLHFEDDFYNISVYWDRVVVKSEGDINKFKNSNSIISTPFFDIYNKITKIPTFGASANHLIHFIAINPIEKEPFEILNTFKEKYLNPHSLNRYGNFNDFCIVTENRDGIEELKIEHGPYFGIEDLEKRNLNLIKNSNEYIKAGKIKGEMIAYTKFEKVNSINFNSFKHLLSESLDSLEKIWNQ
jgi:hypothetical protein